jgi:streptogramin lyase
MQSRHKWVYAFTILASSLGFGATVTGVVKGPDGAPFRAAFVQAQSSKTRISVYVLSDDQGRYRVENLPAGEYRVQVRATGYRSTPKTGLTLTAQQNSSLDFDLAKSPVRWSDLNFYQGLKLLPAGKGKEVLTRDCSVCHMFQNKMATALRDQEGWRDRIQYMQTAMRASIQDRLSEADATALAAYLASVWGPEATVPKSPEDVPGYKETLRSPGSESLNIVYVEYDMPGPNRMPFSAAPDKEGNIWIPNFGVVNKVTRLDPQTGESQDFPVPSSVPTLIHSATPGPDGGVWIAEQGTNKVGRIDPKTGKVDEYQDPYLPGQEGMMEGGQKHTVRFDKDGNIWSSGTPLTRLDLKTKKFTQYKETGFAYDVFDDKNGDIWFTIMGAGKIGKVDAKTLKLTSWSVPTPNSRPRRIVVDKNGIAWAGLFGSGKILRFDPATSAFKEYPLPGPNVAPYGLGLDADDNVWYSSFNLDTLGRLETATGKIIEYPFPHSENTVREFFRDSRGRVWYGSPSNNKVGYFYFAGKPPAANPQVTLNQSR